MGQLWRSYCTFREDTRNDLPIMCDAAVLAFARWRERQHAAKQGARKGRKTQAGTTIASTISQLKSCFVYFNGVTEDPPNLARAQGVGGGFKSHLKKQAKQHKRGGGQSFGISKDEIDAAVTPTQLADSPRWLRTSGLVIAMAASGAARFDDLRKIDVKATIERLLDGGNGSTRRFGGAGETFANTENYLKDVRIFQVAVGITELLEFGKHRSTVVWKDMGPRDGAACRMFVDWYGAGPKQTRALKPDAIIHFPGKFVKQAGKGARWGVNAQGFPTHYRFDHTIEMGSSKASWLRDIFSALCFENGTIDPALMGTKLGAALAAGSFHGVRRGSCSAAEAARASRLGMQTQLGHKNDPTQDGYKELSYEDRMQVLGPNEITLGDGATLPDLPHEFSMEGRAAARREAFVESAKRITALAQSDGEHKKSVGPGGYAAICSPSAGRPRTIVPVFVLHGACKRYRVLLLREREIRVVAREALVVWPTPAREPADNFAAPTAEPNGDHSGHGAQPPDSFTAFMAALGGDQDKHEATPKKDSNMRRARSPRTRQDWKLGDGIRQRFGRNRQWFTGVAESQYFNAQEQRRNTRFRFEDNDMNDRTDDELQALIDDNELVRIPKSAATCGQPTWRTCDRGGSANSPTDDKTLATSARVGAASVTPTAAWRATWRLRQRADGSWAPCVVRGVMLRHTTPTGEIFITCPFQGTAGVILAKNTRPWTATLGDEIWDAPAQE